MTKCLKTMLTGTVSNDSLLKLGEMRISFTKLSNPTSNTQKITLQVGTPMNIRIIGNGHFTDKSLTQNSGTTLHVDNSISFYVSNGDFEVSIPNKYAIIQIISYAGFDIDMLKYSKELNNVQLLSDNIHGDISAFKDSVPLGFMNMSSKNIHGDILAFKDLVNITYLETNIDTTGDIANLKGLKNLTYFSLNNVYGDISFLSTFSKLISFTFRKSSIIGDISKMPNDFTFASITNNSSSLSWTERDSSAKIIAIQGAPNISNLDKMLIDQSACQVGSQSNSDIAYKTIDVKGTRTSSSDTAVSTLKSKGYTIIVNGVTL